MHAGYKDGLKPRHTTESVQYGRDQDGPIIGLLHCVAYSFDGERLTIRHIGRLARQLLG